MSEEIESKPRRDDLNSMLYWWPRVSKLGEAWIVPMPKTLIYEIPNQQLRQLSEESMETLEMKPVRALARKLGYPLFMRTDQCSGKHDWLNTCFVPSEAELPSHIRNLFVDNWCADILGLPFKALVFRQYIPMYSLFTAFNGLPISKERRYFVKDHKVVCHHAYWPENAVEEGNPSSEHWRSQLAELNMETPKEVENLSKYAEAIGYELPGYWSIDFCLSKTKRWYFIDAALAKDSYHDPSCIMKKEVKANAI